MRKRPQRGTWGLAICRLDEQAAVAIRPPAPPDMTRGGGSVGAASVEEMEPRPLGQEPRLGQLMAIGGAPSLDLPDGGGLADDVEHLRTARAKMRFSCTMPCPFRTPSGNELENKRL